MQTQERPYFLTGVAISVVGALCFSTKAILVKLAYRDFDTDALSLLGLRMLFSLPFFLFFSLKSYHRHPMPKTAGQWAAICATGLLGYHLSSLLDFAGLRYISAGLERLILFIYPTLVLLMSSVFFGERITGRQWAAVAISYAGIVLAFFGENRSGPEWSTLTTGALLVFGCALTYGSYILIGSRIIPQTGPSVFNSFSMLAACIGVLLHVGLSDDFSPWSMPAGLLGYGLLMAVISTVIPSFLVAESIRRIGGENTAIVASVGPVSTIFMAWWWLGEKVTWLQSAGTLAILAGVWIIASTRSPRQSKG